MATNKQWSDRGTIAWVKDGIAAVRFAVYGTRRLPVEKLIFNRDTDAWKFLVDKEFIAALDAIVGKPKVNQMINVYVPAVRGGWYSRHETGFVTAVDNKGAHVIYNPESNLWSVPSPEDKDYKKLKTKIIPFSDMKFNWHDKRWVENEK